MKKEKSSYNKKFLTDIGLNKEFKYSIMGIFNYLIDKYDLAERFSVKLDSTDKLIYYINYNRSFSSTYLTKNDIKRIINDNKL